MYIFHYKNKFGETSIGQNGVICAFSQKKLHYENLLKDKEILKPLIEKSQVSGEEIMAEISTGILK